jgi:hypothetical protein
MNDFFGKMREVEADLARERGGVLFFGLLKSADLPDRWDVVITARWVTDSQLTDLRYLADKLRSRLTPDEMLSLARIVLLAPDESSLLARGGLFDIKQGSLQLVNVPINDMVITHAYVITADSAALKQSAPAAARELASNPGPVGLPSSTSP